MAKFIIGKKLGMTQVFKEDGTALAVTFIEVKPNVVVQIKTKEKDGYEAVQFGSGEKKKIAKPQKGHFKNLGNFRLLKEFKSLKIDDKELQVGDKIDASVFSVGDKVKVKVLASHEGKLAFSMKQAEGDPWQGIEKKFKAEDKVTGKVVRVSDFGYFVELIPGVEGLIHITQVPPSMKIATGDEVKCVVEEVNTKDKRIALGLVLTSVPLGYK